MVLTWLWEQPGGRVRYTAEHVNIWADMVRRNLRTLHRLACVTDIPAGLDPRIAVIEPPHEFEDVVIPTWTDGKPQCFRRLSMFRRDAAKWFGERFVCMDMDCVISGPIDDLFQRTEDIVLYASPPASPFVGAPRPYNGSMVMLTAGARPEVYEQFTAAGAMEAGQRYAGSDQAWISHVLGDGEAVWNERDGVVWWGRWADGMMGRITFFPGAPKPWELVDHHAFVREHYHRDLGGRCLVLGYGPSLWRDVDAALDAGFDAVIASPEAAEHWPGPVLAVARDDDDAERLVRTYGFDAAIFCGRQNASAVEAA